VKKLYSKVIGSADPAKCPDGIDGSVLFSTWLLLDLLGAGHVEHPRSTKTLHKPSRKASLNMTTQRH